ncbi:M48 family metallopeptidase [Hylemonella gracilis]|uniref:M48 family metallopeptidase n=1 Tax=Hylemonella gracilis TaxID=80880 RepID=UPI0012DF0A15|nr:M48 family metallopeptidase [Hylemonella gracilis]
MSNVSPSTSSLNAESPQALYFDGRSARPLPVRLDVDRGDLRAWCVAEESASTVSREASGVEIARWPLKQVQWPERTRHGQRVILLAHGGSLQVADAAAFDAWRVALGHSDGWVVRAQLHWRGVLLALVLLLGLLLAGYRWGLPWAAVQVVRALPAQVDEALGQEALGYLDAHLLSPSSLPAQRQAELRAALDQALRAMDAAPVPWTLHFRAGVPGSETLDPPSASSTDTPSVEPTDEGGTGEGKSTRGGIGPNALALPGGHIIVTDELVQLLDGRDDALLGVLGHEYGHVRLRHGMQSLARLTLASAAVSVVVGDFSSLLGAVPLLLAQMDYSRHAEREADAEAVRLLRANRLSPEAMVVFFERMAARQPARRTREEGGLPIALSSHPADAERIRFFTEAARP